MSFRVDALNFEVVGTPKIFDRRTRGVGDRMVFIWLGVVAVECSGEKLWAGYLSSVNVRQGEQPSVLSMKRTETYLRSAQDSEEIARNMAIFCADEYENDGCVDGFGREDIGDDPQESVR